MFLVPYRQYQSAFAKCIGTHNLMIQAEKSSNRVAFSSDTRMLKADPIAMDNQHIPTEHTLSTAFFKPNTHKKTPSPKPVCKHVLFEHMCACACVLRAHHLAQH